MGRHRSTLQRRDLLYILSAFQGSGHITDMLALRMSVTFRLMRFRADASCETPTPIGSDRIRDIDSIQSANSLFVYLGREVKQGSGAQSRPLSQH